MSKINKLKKHLMEGRPITGAEALSWWGYYRLSDGILRLRSQGMNIKTIMVEGRDCRFAKYYLQS